jgi:3-phosphoshikimate 1-carboxyvinyltransferase
MSNLIVSPIKRIKGIISLPGDKSISHRALMLGAIAKGTTLIENLSFGEDCLRTIDAFRKMGIEITQRPRPNTQHQIIIEARGLYGLKPPKKPLYMGNSGTTMRLLLGILAGQDFKCTLTAGGSLSRRPMRRVIEPLRMMGAKIEAKHQTPLACQIALQPGQANTPGLPNSSTARAGKYQEEYPPITIRGGRLKAISYRLPIPSAQVKSAILLASLYAQGVTSVIESIKSRDHTERMLKIFGASLKVERLTPPLRAGAGLRCKLKGPCAALYSPGKIKIPGDISSAAFFLIAAAALPESHLVIKSVGLNPTRTGIIDVLKRMGADIVVHSPQCPAVHSYEPVGDIVVKGGRLKGIIIEKNEIPRLIDELPILMVAASLSKGKTLIKGAGELRVKETDRINSMSTNLNKMGADIVVHSPQCPAVHSSRNKEDVIIIRGKEKLRGVGVNSFGDHRTAMSMVIAGLFAEGRTIVEDASCINKSFPEFMEVLKGITK